MSEEEGTKRKWVYAPFGLVLLWCMLGYALWRDGLTPLNKGIVGVVTLWSVYRIVRYVRS